MMKVSRGHKFASKSTLYRKGVEWIALNDEPSELDQETVSNQISTLLLADLFGIHEIAVADDIIEVRENDTNLL